MKLLASLIGLISSRWWFMDFPYLKLKSVDKIRMERSMFVYSNTYVDRL